MPMPLYRDCRLYITTSAPCAPSHVRERRLESGNETSSGHDTSDTEGGLGTGAGVSWSDWAGGSWRNVSTRSSSSWWLVSWRSWSGGVVGWVVRSRWLRWWLHWAVWSLWRLWSLSWRRSSVDGLGHGAWAVGDGQGGGLGDGVSDAVVLDRRGRWAEGLVAGHDLGGVAWAVGGGGVLGRAVRWSVRGRNDGSEAESCDSELHLDGNGVFLLVSCAGGSE